MDLLGCSACGARAKRHTFHVDDQIAAPRPSPLSADSRVRAGQRPVDLVLRAIRTAGKSISKSSGIAASFVPIWIPERWPDRPDHRPVLGRSRSHDQICDDQNADVDRTPASSIRTMSSPRYAASPPPLLHSFFLVSFALVIGLVLLAVPLCLRYRHTLLLFFLSCSFFCAAGLSLRLLQFIAPLCCRHQLFSPVHSAQNAVFRREGTSCLEQRGHKPTAVIFIPPCKKSKRCKGATGGDQHQQG